MEWYGTGFDRLEPVAPVLCCTRAAKPKKGRVQRRWPLIHGMIVAAMSVRLPDFNQRVGYRHPIAIEYTPLDANALTRGLRSGQHVEAVIFAPQSGAEERGPRLRAGRPVWVHPPPP